MHNVGLIIQPRVSRGVDGRKKKYTSRVFLFRELNHFNTGTISGGGTPTVDFHFICTAYKVQIKHVHVHPCKKADDKRDGGVRRGGGGVENVQWRKPPGWSETLRLSGTNGFIKSSI